MRLGIDGRRWRKTCEPRCLHSSTVEIDRSTLEVLQSPRSRQLGLGKLFEELRVKKELDHYAYSSGFHFEFIS